MKKIIFISALLFVVLPSLAQFSNRTFTVGNTSRSYRQYLPTGFDPTTEPNLPLVIALHGIGDNMTNFSNTGFHLLANTDRFLVVFPQGLPNFLSQNSWNNGTLLSSGADDIGFLSMLIDTMKVKYNIDLSRVYFTGFSMGGIMSYHMLCALPSRVAAIASVSGPMSEPDITGCDPGRAVPIMHMHGTADATVPYDTNALPSLNLVPATMQFWKNNNGCGDSAVYNLPDSAPSDNITVDTIVFSNCNAPVILWRENNANHQWLYQPLNDISATVEIWNFFKDKVHPGPSQLGTPSSLADDNTTFSISFNQQNLEIKHTTPIRLVRIFDMQGKLILQKEGNNQNQVYFSMQDLSSQLLLIQVETNGRNLNRKWMHIRN